MATDKRNQKICRIPPAKDEDFMKSIPAAGSQYFRQAGGTLIVGDGYTPGGVEFVNREWVLQKIMEANLKAKLEKESLKSTSSATLSSFLVRDASSITRLVGALSSTSSATVTLSS